jgi:hypothetical protein
MMKPGSYSRLVAHVVVDADGEVRLGPLLPQFVENGLDHRGRELLGGQSVAPADHSGQGGGRQLAGGVRLHERGDHVEVQGFRPWRPVLGPVQHRDGAVLRDGIEQMPGREGPVQVDLDEADRFAAGLQVHHGLAHGPRRSP